MIKNLPGIFNDVVGPVMRGPSSSHTAASWRIARVCLEILHEPLRKAIIEFDKSGAWASNFREQGTEMGINGGLLGLDMTDPQMKNTGKVADERGVSITYEVNSFQTRHPNTVRLSLEGLNGQKVQVKAASIGGGSFEIQQIDGFEVSIRGDYFELLILNKNNKPIPNDVKSIISHYSSWSQSSSKNEKLINIKSSKAFPDEIMKRLTNFYVFERVIAIDPILPIVSGNETEMPFTTIESLLKYSKSENLDLGKMGLIYAKCRSGFSESKLFRKMEDIVGIIEKSIETGLQGTKYEDRILHQQSHLVKKAEEAGKIPQNSVVNKTIAYVTAIMESKSAMEVIVANPTAGSCGTVGGSLKAVADDLNATKDELIKAYFAAGIVGAFFATGPGFSAEAHGCQVECGAASGMAAAGIAQLFGGTAKQAIDAASMAIQNMIGLICDPVADRVEVPCLGKNVSAAANALTSATMACSGFDAVIPLEEVIETVENVGRQMPACVKCTGKGGLAVTKAAQDLKDRLSGN
nr:L-serine ammonia-lyase, iron-sulfur-dependent, subunit alpha [Bacteroidota bacterium]